MKTHNNILFVELPEGATDVHLKDKEGMPIALMVAIQPERSLPSYFPIVLPQGNYKLIGTTPLTEEEWQEVVEEDRWYSELDGELDIGYKDYNGENNYPPICYTATESGLSLLEHLGLDKNYAILLKI